MPWLCCRTGAAQARFLWCCWNNSSPGLDEPRGFGITGVAPEQLISFSSPLIMSFLSIMGPSSPVNAEIITSQMSVKCCLPILILQRGLSRAGSPCEGASAWEKLLTGTGVKINSRAGLLGTASSPGNGVPWILCPEHFLPVPFWSIPWILCPERFLPVPFGSIPVASGRIPGGLCWAGEKDEKRQIFT